MLCKKPFNSRGVLFGCGQCTPCRLNKRREWTHRLILESHQHERSSFITLTYSDDTIPLQDGTPTLAPADLQKWLKRFRLALSPLRIRFFAVGEYGDATQRPHYHALVFGAPTCARGRTGGIRGTIPADDCCLSCQTLNRSWGLGRVFQGSVTPESCQYVAGYTVKKMTDPTHPANAGRHPEFSRQSRHPGIGTWAMEDVALTIMQSGHVAEQEDVPTALIHGKRVLPLGRYLRRKLRKALGRKEEALDRQESEEMRAMRAVAFHSGTSLSEVVVEAYEHKNLSLEARLQIRERKKHL